MEQQLDTGLVKGHAYGISDVKKVFSNLKIYCFLKWFKSDVKWNSFIHSFIHLSCFRLRKECLAANPTRFIW